MAQSSTPTTLCDIIEQSLARHARDRRYGYKRDGEWSYWSSDEMRRRMLSLAGGLMAAGIGHGDRVAIISPTRIEWTLAEYAILTLGAVVVPVYPSSTPEQVGHIVRHAGVRLVFIANDALWSPIVPVLTECDTVERVVGFEPLSARSSIRVDQLDALLQSSAPPPPKRPQATDLASIIYTSGTTGEPKGVMLSHANILSNVLACTEACPFSPDDVQLSFLPLSHIFERMVHFYFLWNGLTICYVDDMSKLGQYLSEVRPTVLTAVPRVLEKVLGTVEEKAAGHGIAAHIARTAIDAGRLKAQVMKGGERSSLALALKLVVAERLVFSKIRAKLGGRLRVVVTGGAATPDRLTEFFTGAGVEILPGYGLTESSPVVAFNTPRAFRFGSVGRPIPGTEIRIASDGEIETRGAGVMRGYYKNEAATREAVGADGWLRTGDIGHLDQDGFLYITDRKKNILVTSQGKNVAPQPIEDRLLSDPMIQQVMLIGDGRPYITALVVPTFKLLLLWAREQGIASEDVAMLVSDGRVVELFKQRIDSNSHGLARHETVKRFVLLEREFSEVEGELTPTLKIKRRVVEGRYKILIDQLYG